jgi:four helix bundle protein
MQMWMVWMSASDSPPQSGKVERFEDLIAWRKARVLTREIYAATRKPAFKSDRALCAQIQRAATSIMSNIAEGFERGGNREFHHFLVMAKGSCAEVRSQLYIAYDAGYLTQSEFTRLLDQAAEVGRVIGGLRASVDRRLSSSS